MGILVALNAKDTFSTGATTYFKTSLLVNLKYKFDGLPSINTAATGCPGVPNTVVDWSCN